MSLRSSKSLILIITLLISIIIQPIRGSHVVNFKSLNLYPESLSYDPVSQHFVVGSLKTRQILSVSDASVTETFIFEQTIPKDTSIVGITVDMYNRRILATTHALSPLPPFSSLLGYDLKTRKRIFVGMFPESVVANDVAVDHDGNAFVSDSAGNQIWKVDKNGVATLFSKSDAFSSFTIEQNKLYSSCGLNGLVYISKGYLLVVQSNTGWYCVTTEWSRLLVWCYGRLKYIDEGKMVYRYQKLIRKGVATLFSKLEAFSSFKIEQNRPYSTCGLNGLVYNSKGYLLVDQSNTGKMFKVNVHDGSARNVILNKDLTAADGIAVRRDGVVIVVSQYKAYFIKSSDSWGEGVVFDETPLDEKRFASSVTVGADERVYVLYGHIDEAISGNSEREEFSIVQIESEKENKDDAVWVYILVGFGFAYFCFWRFQMKHLYTNMDKKIA